MLKGILVMSCIRPCVQLFMGLALCIADKSLGRNGQQIGMLMYPDDLCSAVIDNYGYYCLCVCLTVCWCFHLLGLVWWLHFCPLVQPFGFFFFFLLFFFIFFSKVRVGAKEGGSHYWEMAVAITCGYGGYLLPLLAAHSSWKMKIYCITSFQYNVIVGWGITCIIVAVIERSSVWLPYVMDLGTWDV